uniref:Tyrosine-protein phosphatase n=4 Tax=Pararge aegeria TaxID=116150 RepID=S4P8B2_9NEOP
MKDKSSRQTTPNRSNLQKSYSENKVCDETDIGNYSSQENTPQKKTTSQKFNTWRGQLMSRPKRRPLSLSIPTGVNIPDDYLNDDSIMKRSSLKSIQSSLNSLDKSIKSSSSKNVALPRNYGLSRRWLGPVRYPVTPCKNNPTDAINSNIIRRHFVYGTGDSDEEQIFL